MITFKDFLKNLKNNNSNSKYRYFTYENPSGNFDAGLYYDYCYGWGCKVIFKENPEIGIFFEDGSDKADSVIESLNKCIPFYDKIKNEEGDPVGFIIDDFKEVIPGHFEYEDSNKNFKAYINYNGSNYCALNAFFGKLDGKSLNIFFEQDTIKHTLDSFNQCLPTIIEMYNTIKDLKIEEAY